MPLIASTPVKVTKSSCQSPGSPSLFDYSEPSVLSAASPSRFLFCWFLSQPALPLFHRLLHTGALLRSTLSSETNRLIPDDLSHPFEELLWLLNSESIIHMVVTVKGNACVWGMHIGPYGCPAPNVPLDILQNKGLFYLLTVKLWKAELTS